MYQLPTSHGERLSRRVSIALLAVDDFTDQMIIGQGVVAKRPLLGHKAIAKSDGYHIFTNCGGSVTVEVTAPCFHPEQVEVETDGLDPLFPLVKVRLKPNRLYVLPPGAICLSGRAEPGAAIRLTHENDPKPLKLLYDYSKKKDGERIFLFHPPGQDIDGKRFAIRDKAEGLEHFRVGGRLEDKDGAYRMDAPLKKDYKKIGTAVFPVYTTRVDDEGRYFLPLWNPGGDAFECVIQSVGNETVEKKITVGRRKETVVDLR